MTTHFALKGQCNEIFCFWFFSWTSFPQASDYTIRPLRIFSKICGDIRSSRQMKKTFKQKNFNNLVWTPLGSRVNIYINFCLQVHFKVSAAWYCCHYLPPMSLTPVANLPPVSLVVANLPPVSTTLAKMVENLPPVSLTPVVHLDLRISLRIFEKVRNSLNGILWGGGETDSWKKPEAKNLVTLSLKGERVAAGSYIILPFVGDGERAGDTFSLTY